MDAELRRIDVLTSTTTTLVGSGVRGGDDGAGTSKQVDAYEGHRAHRLPIAGLAGPALSLLCLSTGVDGLPLGKQCLVRAAVALGGG